MPRSKDGTILFGTVLEHPGFLREHLRYMFLWPTPDGKHWIAVKIRDDDPDRNPLSEPVGAVVQLGTSGWNVLCD